MPKTTLPQDASQLDPKIIKVMGAIKRIESGGDYNAVGDNGQSHGAYQWNKDNFVSQAKQYGLDSNDMSPSNQNKVAYARIKQLKDEGKQPEEIAALWNGAKKQSDGTYTYINPEYGNKFRNALQENSSQSKSSGQFVNPNQNSDSGSNFVVPPKSITPESPTNQDPQKQEGILSKIGHGALGILNAVESPFIGAAAIPTQLLAKAIGVPDPFEKGFPGIAGSNVDVTPLSVEKKAGDIAQVGSYFVPGSGVIGAAGMGALQGAGSALSKGGDAAQVATDTGEGALLGGAAGGAAKLAGAGLNHLGGLISGEAAQKSLQGIKDAYASALNLNASERAFENRTGKDLAEVLTKNEVSLGRHENGTLDASQAIPKLQGKLDPLNQQATELLNHPQGVVKNIEVGDVQNSINSKIDAMTIPEVEKEDARKLVANYLSAESKKYGNEWDPATTDKIKQAFWASTFDRNRTNLQNHIPYLVGKELQNATEKAVKGTDTEIDLHSINAERSDLIDAIRRLQKMDEVKLLKGGRLGNIAGGTVGAIAGATSGLGPMGTLAGDYFGQKAAQFLQDPATKIALAKGTAKATGLIPKIVGRSSVPIGKGVSKVGRTVSRSARSAGLIGNVLSNSR